MKTQGILYTALVVSILTLISSCKKDKQDDEPITGPAMNFKFDFNENQERLDNFGNPDTMPSGHAGQNPRFNAMSAHYVELTPTKWTALGDGAVLYKNEETTQGGAKAILFDKEKKAAEGEVFLSVPLSSVPAGTYEYIRVSLSYQNFDVDLRASNIDLTGTLASFVGYNTYIGQVKVKNKTVTVNANKAQGFWAFETIYSLNTGQAPATTVPNPLSATSPIPAGSCVVTGKFDPPLVISESENSDIAITISLSVNKSFEWEDSKPDGIWEPDQNENVVDMGLRGLIPYVSR